MLSVDHTQHRSARDTGTSEGVGDDADSQVLEPYVSLEEPRLVLDLRPDSAFHQAHIANSYHIAPVSELKSRYSYLPPRNVPFLVVANDDQFQEVTEAFSSTPSAKFIFLSDSTSNALSEQTWSKTESFRCVDSKVFFQSIRRLDLVRSSQSHQQRVMVQRRAHDETASQGAYNDAPELLFRPSNAVRRTVTRMEDDQDHFVVKRVLDLGCGAARDLAWILHGSRSRTSSCTWTAVGVDNWKAVLNRAQQLSEDLFLCPRMSGKTTEPISAPLCETLLWAKCSDDGFLEPLVGTGKGKSIRTPAENDQLWNEYVQVGLEHLLPGSDSLGATTSDQVKFDLILCIRFHPRSLLPRLSHLVRTGGIVLLSHFVTLSDQERQEAIQAHPDAIVDYESPPHEGRLQPNEVEGLLAIWNELADPGVKWIIDHNVLEPIEDGRTIKSVALRKVES